MIALPLTLRAMHLPKLIENPYRLSQLASSLEILVQQFGNLPLADSYNWEFVWFMS